MSFLAADRQICSHLCAHHLHILPRSRQHISFNCSNVVTLHISCMFATVLACCSSSDAASVKP